MAFKFNPLTGQLDLVGDGGTPAASDDVYIRRSITNLTVSSGITYVQHEMELSGTLTLVGSAELLVI